MDVQQGNRAEAISLWEKLLIFNPNDGVLHWDLSVAYGQQGNQKLAAYHLRLAQDIAQQATNQTINVKNSQ
jgi:Flp pilus assembly protein TadD